MKTSKLIYPLLLATMPALHATTPEFFLDENANLFGGFNANSTTALGNPPSTDFFDLGSNSQFTAAGTVAMSPVSAGDAANPNSGVFVVPGGMNTFGEGPVDGSSLLITNGTTGPGPVGTTTLINNSASSGARFDLSSGNSARLVFAFDYIENQAADGGGSFDPDFTLFEIGFTTTASNGAFFGDTNDDSFFLAGVADPGLQQRGNAATIDQFGDDFNLVAFDENIGVANGDSLGLGTEIVTDLTLDAVAISGPNDQTATANLGGISYLYDITFTTNATDNTLFDISYTITEFEVSGLQSADTITPTGTVLTGTESVAHGLDTDNLDSLDLGLGFRTLSTNTPLSGTSFDGVSEFIVAIPEPSSLVFMIFSLPLAFIRRRK